MDLETIKLKIRKNKDIIYTNGYGILVFMFWSLIKTALYLIDIAPEITPGADDNLVVLYYSLIASSSIVEDVLTIITGIVAIRVGKKNKSRRILLPLLSLITFVLSLEFVIGDAVLCAFIASDNIGMIIISILVDVFFLTMTLFLTISSFKLNRLRKLEKGAIANER